VLDVAAGRGSQRAFWVIGTLLMGAGLFRVAGATDPQVGWKFGIAFGSVGFVPAALSFRLATGTRLWLTPDGIERSRWPRKSARWVDVLRIVPLVSGSPSSGIDAANAIELQMSPSARGWARLSGSKISRSGARCSRSVLGTFFRTSKRECRPGKTSAERAHRQYRAQAAD
jgi:hypothetical protein